MFRLLLLVLFIGTALSVTGCSGECDVVGSTQPCICASGDTGAQVCQADGAWSSCDCESEGEADSVGITDLDAVDDSATADAEMRESTDLDASDRVDELEVGDDSDSVSDLDGDTADRPARDTTEDGTDTSRGTDAFTVEPCRAAVDGPVMAGSVVIRNQLDADELTSFRGITGDLSVETRGLGSLTLASIQCVGGDISVVENDLISLALPALTKIGGELLLEANVHLTSLDFGALNRVGASLRVAEHEGLSVLGLGDLESIGGDLTIMFSPELTSLSGLRSLSQVAGAATIRLNDSIAEVRLPDLQYVGGDFWAESSARLDSLVEVRGSLVLSGGDRVVSVVADHLESVGLNLTIGGELVETLTMSQLRTVGGDLSCVRVRDVEFPLLGSVVGRVNIQIASSAQFPTLSQIGGAVHLSQVNGLAIPVLRDVGGGFTVNGGDLLEILDVPRLETVAGHLSFSGAGLLSASIPMVFRVDSDVTISGNQVLESITLGTELEVGRSFRLEASESLLSSGLDLDITRVVQDVEVKDNPLLVSHGLDSLLSVGGSLTLSGNPGFTVVEFPELQEVGSLLPSGENLTVISAPELFTAGTVGCSDVLRTMSFPSLDALGHLKWRNCTALEDVAMPELQVVSSMGRSIWIENNDALATLEFPRLRELGGDLEVEENPVLQTLSIGTEATEPREIAGTVRVSNNALTTLHLDGVENVAEQVSIQEDRMTDLSIADLQTVGGALSLTVGDLRISLPELRVVGNAVVVIGCVDLPKLQEALSATIVVPARGHDYPGCANLVIGDGLSIIHGSLSIGGAGGTGLTSFQASVTDAQIGVTDNENLISFQVDGLESGGLGVTDNPVLEGFGADGDGALSGITVERNRSLLGFNVSTTSLDDLRIAENELLEAFTLDISSGVRGVYISQNAALSQFAIPDSASLTGLIVSYNDSLSSFAIPELVSSQGVGIYNNATLSTFTLPNLSELTAAFRITENALLPQCIADRLLAQLDAAPPSIRTFGNNGVCP